MQHMPTKELDWKEPSWGSAKMAGPIIFNRYTGTAFGREVRIEVWILHGLAGEGDQYITELSFKTDDFEDAAAGREAITAGLTEAGLLVLDDALKTQEILDAYFSEYMP